MNPIYLDYAATTPVDPYVIEKMQGCLGLTGVYGNPASQHFYGEKAKRLIEDAREKIATTIAATPQEIIFTSGATESNNLALQGAAALYKSQGKHIITMRTEHKSVLDTCHYLEKQGFNITYLKPTRNGLLDMRCLEAAITKETILISIMHVNNETGVIQDIKSIGNIARLHNILLHVDAAQSIGKLNFNVKDYAVDLVSFSGHKVYGPKGIGVLYLRQKPRVRVQPLMYGGGHEQGMRSGTLATHQIVGIAEAFSLAFKLQVEEYTRISALRSMMLNELKMILPFELNTSDAPQVPHLLNFRLLDCDAETFLKRAQFFVCSTASACQGQANKESYVLKAMGFNRNEIKNSLRVSLGRFTTEKDIFHIIDLIKNTIKSA